MHKIFEYYFVKISPTYLSSHKIHLLALHCQYLSSTLHLADISYLFAEEYPKTTVVIKEMLLQTSVYSISCKKTIRMQIFKFGISLFKSHDS